jgi:diguanylate cyclase (GGDEF)-like protein/PAS domain S-box-containing protein
LDKRDADIADRRQSEEDLREPENRYRLVFEANPVPMWVYARETHRFLAVNGAALKRYGYSREEFLSMSILEIRPPEDIPLLLDDLKDMSSESSVGQWRHLSKDGKIFFVEVASHELKFAGVQARMVVAKDVTERRQSEKLQSALYRIAEITSSARDLTAFYSALHEIVGELMDARNFYLALYDPASDTIRFPYFVDEFDPVPVPKKPGRGLTELVLRTGTPQLVSSETFSRFVEEGKVELQGAPSIDWLGVPLQVGSQTVGVLVVQSYTKEIRYGEPEKHILTFVSQHIASALERKRNEEALQRSERHYRNLFESANDAVLIFEPESEVVLEVNQKALEIYGFPREELIGMSLRSITENPAKGEERLRELLREGSVQNFETVHRTRDGRRLDLVVSASVVDYDGRPAVLSINRDVTESRQVEKQIEQLAYHDSLTGLANRLQFDERLNTALAQAKRQGHSIAILFMDLDRFKVVNDSLGHKVGDLLLQQAASRLQEMLRGADTLARLGGDEFILLLSRIERPENAAVVARKILELFRRPFSVAGRELFVTMSVGIGVCPYDGEDSDSLVKSADIAMYLAKQKGRDNYEFHARAIEESGLERLDLEAGMRRGLDAGEFLAHYQPQMRLATGKTTGMEALLRWQHPSRGLVLPSDFIPLAEETGLILPLGSQILREACAQTRAWQQMGWTGLRISVNLSVRQLQRQDAAERIGQIVVESGIDPSWVSLEITESLAMQGLDTIVRKLHELKALGLGITMDDFGTGYSSLSYLKLLPVDTIKIDRAFIRDLATDPNDASIVRAAIVMAHELKLQVVAEGVETEEQLAFLRQSHCDEVQGFLFSAALGAREFEALLRTRKTRKTRIASEPASKPARRP